MYGSKHEETELIPIHYVQKRIRKFETMLNRFPEKISFKDQVVLDVGSGFGALSIFSALADAKSVVGIDPDPVSVETANNIIRDFYPSLANRVVFHCCKVKDLDDLKVDLAVSLAVFEHVESPVDELRAVKRVLKKGGRFYLGIGPLFYAPWGDHGRLTGLSSRLFPWAHLLVNQDAQIRNKFPEITHESIQLQDVGLNGFVLDDYIKSFNDSGLRIEWKKINCHENTFLECICNLLSKIPKLRKYFVLNIYAILRNQ